MMLEKVLKKVGVTKEDLIAEHLSIKERIRNHEVGVNCPAPLLFQVAEEFRRTFKFESNTESFWFSLTDVSSTIQNDSVDFHSSTNRCYDLVITPMDAQVHECLVCRINFDS